MTWSLIPSVPAAAWIHEQRLDHRRRRQFVQQLQLLRREPSSQRHNAGDIVARAVETSDQPECDRVRSHFEHDRNCRGCRFRRRPPGHAGREDRADPASNQIGRESPQTIILVFRPSIFDRQVATFDIADFAQSLMESTQPGGVTLGRCAVEKSDHRHCRLLRARRERPRGYRATEQTNELAPLHVGPPANQAAARAVGLPRRLAYHGAIGTSFGSAQGGRGILARGLGESCIARPIFKIARTFFVGSRNLNHRVRWGGSFPRVARKRVFGSL
jgi:hypothetical protein